MIEVLEKKENNLVSIKVEGKIEKGAMLEQINQMMKEKKDQYGQIRLYLEIPSFEGYSNLGALFEDLRLTLEHYNSIEKMAVITQEVWIRSLAPLSNLITKGEVKTFELQQKDEARAWLQLR